MTFFLPLFVDDDFRFVKQPEVDPNGRSSFTHKNAATVTTDTVQGARRGRLRGKKRTFFLLVSISLYLFLLSSAFSLPETAMEKDLVRKTIKRSPPGRKK